jgi:hypothetical protein
MVDAIVVPEYRFRAIAGMSSTVLSSWSANHVGNAQFLPVDSGRICRCFGLFFS